MGPKAQASSKAEFLPIRDIAAALLSASLLGVAFIFVRLGVETAPPLLLTGFRFLAAAIPAIFFIKPPKTSFKLVVLYGLLIGVGQFGLLFVAIQQGMPIGLASLVIQLQAFITMGLAWILLDERPQRHQIVATAIVLIGIAIIGAARVKGANLAPFLLIIAAAFCWACGNIVGKKAGRVDMFAFTVWSSLVAPLPLLGLSILFEGGDRVLYTLTHPTLLLVLCVIVLAYGATILGFGLWAKLLSHHPAAAIAPFALLIPIVGMISGRLVFAEPLSATEFVGALLVLAGLAFNIFGYRFFALLFRA